MAASDCNSDRDFKLVRRRRAKMLGAPMCLAILISACSSGASDPGEIATTMAKGGIPNGGKTKVTSPSPTPIPTTSVTQGPVTYDTSIGLGVDAAGFADLSLRAGAHRYFVSSTKGSDTNSCSAAQSPSTPKASGDAALACATDGEGDQILFAEGTTYPSRLPGMQFRKGGYSLAYPVVFQSYDPADPLNEAKYGRATGDNRPVFTGNTNGVPWFFGNTGQKFIAVRGLNINPGNISGQNVGLMYAGDGILFENNVFRYTGIGIAVNGGPTAHHWVFRGNAIYGAWDSGCGTCGQGIYADGSDSLTIEDNVLYHIGWKIGANRTDSVADGGATMFRHPIYQQLPTDAVVRRNLIIDGAADGGTFRGNVKHTENVIIDSPIAAALGGGTDYNVNRPGGVDIQSSYNAIIGSGTVTGSGATGWGIASQNGKPGSSAHHNLIVMSGFAGAGASAFMTSVTYNAPSYMDYSNNLVYQWSASGQTHYDGYGDTYKGLVFATYNNNIWDDPASGTNTSSAGRSFPNPYTAAQLYVALGFADKQAFVNYAISHPETFPARSARTLLFAGYGL